MQNTRIVRVRIIRVGNPNSISHFIFYLAMLKRNLGGDSEIPAHEILYDANQLRSLAQLQESLDWFSKAILELSSTFRAMNARLGALPNSRKIPSKR